MANTTDKPADDFTEVRAEDLHETDPAIAGQKLEGEPNRLGVALPGVQFEPAPEVIELEQWFHHHVKGTVHATDTEHYNELFRIKELMRLKLQAKHPVADAAIATDTNVEEA